MSNPLNEEAIEAAVDKAADEIEADAHLEDAAQDVGLDLSEFIKRVSVELLARGS